MGLGAILSFDETRATAALDRAKSAFNSFQGSVSKVRSALRFGELAMVPMTTAFAFGAKAAIEFEAQMSKVQAVTFASSGQMAELANIAKRVGVTTMFSGAEAGQAMESLGRAGAGVVGTMTALPGILNAAAAEGLDLGTTTQIVVQSIRSMGLGFDQAGKLANQLALVSAETLTSIQGLGEGMSYVSTVAHAMNIKSHELIATLGILSDSGIDASMAGTQLQQMLSKLSRPTATVRAQFHKWGVVLEDSNKKMLPMPQIVAQISQHLKAVKSDLDRNAIAFQIFGERGMRAFNALAQSEPGRWEELIKKTGDNTDAAAKMAAIRLANLAGQWKILVSTIRTSATDIFGPLLKGVTGFVQDMTGGIHKVLFALQDLSIKLRNNGDIIQTIVNNYGPQAAAIARGIKRGVEDVKGYISDFRDWVKEQFKATDMIPDFKLANWAEFATVVALVGPVIAGIGGALMGIGFILQSVVVPAVAGFIGLLGSIGGVVFGAPLLVLIPAVMLLVGAFESFRKEGESVGTTFLRLWDMIAGGVSRLWTTSIEPFIDGLFGGFMVAWESIAASSKDTFVAIKTIFSELFGFFFEGNEGMRTDWFDVGRAIGGVIGVAASFIARLIATIAQIAVPVVRVGRAFLWMLDMVTTPITGLFRLVAQLGIAFYDVFDVGLVAGLKRAGLAIMDYLLSPIRSLIGAFVDMSDTMKMPVAPGVRAFAKQGALAGPIIPETEDTTAAAMQSATNMSVETANMSVAPKVDITVNPPKAGDTTVNLTLDGEKVATAVAKNNLEVMDRNGTKADPYQRRRIVEQGAVYSPRNK